MDPLRLTFEHSADCASLRSEARLVLGQWHSSDLVDDALLVITELVENVVQHTGDGGRLTMRRHHDAVRIEVADSSPELPRVFGPDPRRIGGRGLLLVAALTREWGTHHQDNGKVVWADIPVSRHP
ncbi:ATP-binding protein [Actinoplanes sp. NPDC089786]|uniref:ATP-binding protein n=1 Tax=Actinoplanes sp. NPDC089786 TaxID=3155185 RepID=UPI003430C84A